MRQSKAVIYLAGGVLLGCSAPVFAQEDGAGALTPSSANIIVTAQRRAERLQEVPATVNFVSAEALATAGVTSSTDLAKVVPGLVVSRIGTYTQPTIRGIGSFLTGPGLENNVAIYLDGFYVPSQSGSAFDLVDIESIQVLKGPQGTLYGRNATGGAIIVTTTEPEAQPNLRVRATYARFDDRRLSAAGSAGIGAGAAIGIAASYRQSDGPVRDIGTGERRAPIRSISIRPKLKLEPSDALSFLLTLEYTDNNDPSGQAFNAYRGNTVARALYPDALVATRPHEVSLNFTPKIDVHVYGAYLKTELDLGAGSITSLTGYRKEHDDYASDNDGTPEFVFHIDPWIQDQRTFMQELIASGSSGPVEWIVGASYFDDFAWLKRFMVFGTSIFSPSQATRAIAGYADATVAVTPRFFVTAGARYNSERRHFKQRPSIDTAPIIDVKKTFQGFTPRLALRYQLSDASSIYASIGRGYKSGIFNSAGFDPNPVNPEKITAYEAGVKIGAGQLRFDAAAFYYRYKDLQTAAYFGSGGNQTVQNAGEARVKGVEASLNWAPSPTLDLRAGATYVRARYARFDNAQDYCPLVASGALPVSGALTCPGGPLVGGNVSHQIDASGQPLIRSPDFTGNVAVDYRLPVADGELQLSGTLYYTSRINFSASGRLRQNGYALLGARGTWEAPGGRWNIGLFGDNILDKRYVQSFFFQELGDFATYGPRATYGVTLGYRL